MSGRRNNNWINLGYLNTLIFTVLVLFAMAGCKTEHRKRPYGFVTLGKIEELKRPVSFFSDKALLLRHDENGFYVMSLLCTHDLAPLEIKQNGETSILSSKFSESTYSLDGKVLTGPSTTDLPFYELVAAQSVPQGSVDTLYAKIGQEKDKNWRLKTQTDSPSLPN